MTFFFDLTQIRPQMTSYFKVTTIDASNFLESEYPSCELMQYKEEVLSLLEQELSYRGDYFIFSELSGWSANVRKERILDDKYFYEMSVIKLIEDFGPFRIVSYVIIRVIHAQNDRATSFDLRVHTFRIDVQFAKYYHDHPEKNFV